MKRLNIEEKAKAYDEAIERANELRYVSGKDSLQCKTAEHIFPEPKKFENDEIRKWLIGYFNQYIIDGMPQVFGNGLNVKDVIAWLEKQGDTNETINRDEFAQGVLRGAAINLITWIDYNAAEGNMCLSNMECKDIEDALVSGDWNKIYAYIKKKLEKQGKFEQCIQEGDNIVTNEDGTHFNISQLERVAKKEPRFNERDWVVLYDSATDIDKKVVQISKVEKTKSQVYRYWTKDDKWFGDGTTARLWTIQDAKDGDVLTSNNGNTFIYHKHDNNYVYYHCSINYFDNITINSSWNVSGVKPANKVQRDLLFQKMKESGYEWDAEKKELKKIEIITPLFNVGDTIIKKHNSDINDFGQFTITDITGGKYWYNDRIICDITEQDEWEFYEPVRQELAWSEEDEETLGWLCTFLKEYGHEFYDGNEENVIDWLKSLKDRLKPQWKPSEEQLNALNTLNLCGDISYVGQQKQLIELYKQLRKL